jgi:hypothetical protein
MEPLNPMRHLQPLPEMSATRWWPDELGMAGHRERFGGHRGSIARRAFVSDSNRPHRGRPKG